MFYGLGGHEGYINIAQIEKITEKENTYTDKNKTITHISYILKFQSGNELEVSKEVVRDIIQSCWYNK